MKQRNSKGGRRKAEGGVCSRTFPLPPSAFPPRGITLIEVLISMFVLLFGLMGVAAIFPVASHYIVEGEKRDRGGGLAQIAFEELKSRKILRPMTWLYPYGHPSTDTGTSEFINPVTKLANMPMPAGPGHAFVIDPLGTAAGLAQTVPVGDLDIFALYSGTAPWPFNNTPPPRGVTGTRFPVRRLTLPVPDLATPDPVDVTWMDPQTADTIFRLRDDLTVQQPEAGDRPSVQNWSKIDPNNTPNNPDDDTLLARQYTGDYSWLATVVPTRQRALEGLQPSANIRDEFYEVTAVVFYKRDRMPSTTIPGSPGSERLIAGEFMNSGELAIYDADATNNDPETVESALDKIKPTNWIAVMGVHQTTGVFLMKWYKVLAVDDEDTEIDSPNPTPNADGEMGRYLMVQGPEWPSNSYQNLRVAILPGAIDAYTRVMQIEQE